MDWCGWRPRRPRNEVSWRRTCYSNVRTVGRRSRGGPGGPALPGNYHSRARQGLASSKRSERGSGMAEPLTAHSLAPLPPGTSPDAVLDRFLAAMQERGLELYPEQEEAILELFAG